jgi:hypothetical protein
LAEYSTVVPDAVTVHFVGYRMDGSIVSTKQARLLPDGRHQMSSPEANPAHSLDAAMSFSLHIGRHWRGASDVQRSALHQGKVTP